MNDIINNHFCCSNNRILGILSVFPAGKAVCNSLLQPLNFIGCVNGHGDTAQRALLGAVSFISMKKRIDSHIQCINMGLVKLILK